EEAPGKGWHWGLEAAHPDFPRGDRTHVGTVAPMEQLLLGPSSHTNGTANLMGALRRAMASTGYTELKDFQKVEVYISETYTG
ncbi:inosine-5-monophosphate dehydrogenase, partial [Staphylococcus aureus]